MKTPVAIIAALLALAALHSWAVWDRLPLQLMAHFDGHGQPNGYAPRGQFFLVYGAIGVGAVLLLLIAPQLTRAVPPGLVNIPNRDYWLAPERREQLQRKLGAFMAWTAVACAALLVAVLELVLRANLAHAPFASGPMALLVAAYLAGSAASIVWLVRAFRVPTAGQAR